MTEGVISENCGNSPKNLFVQDMAIASAEHDIDFLLSNVSDSFFGKSPARRKPIVNWNVGGIVQWSRRPDMLNIQVTLATAGVGTKNMISL